MGVVTFTIRLFETWGSSMRYHWTDPSGTQSSIDCSKCRASTVVNEHFELHTRSLCANEAINMNARCCTNQFCVINGTRIYHDEKFVLTFIKKQKSVFTTNLWNNLVGYKENSSARRTTITTLSVVKEMYNTGDLNARVSSELHIVSVVMILQFSLVHKSFDN